MCRTYTRVNVGRRESAQLTATRQEQGQMKPSGEVRDKMGPDDWEPWLSSWDIWLLSYTQTVLIALKVW